MNEKPSLTDRIPSTYVTLQEDEERIADPVIDSSANCHPCYFHMRMYGEADYFMIGDMDSKAEIISALRS